MKWPEFEAKIKIGGLEKLGEWCAPPPLQMYCSATGGT